MIGLQSWYLAVLKFCTQIKESVLIAFVFCLQYLYVQAFPINVERYTLFNNC